MAEVIVPVPAGSVPIHRAGFEDEEHYKQVQAQVKDPPKLPSDSETNLEGTTGLGFLETLLHVAIRQRDPASMQLLIRSRANVEKLSDENISPLFLAIENGYVDGVKILCKARADVNKAPDGCSSPFWVALLDSDWDLLHILIRANADTNGSFPGTGGCSPLIYMTSHAEAEDDFYSMQILNILLKGRADPNLPDAEGFTPLHYAAKYGHEQMTCLLIKNQADINCPNKKYDEQNRHAGKTALSFAAEQSDLEMTATLLNYGADVATALIPQSTAWILTNLVGPRYEQVKQMLVLKQNNCWQPMSFPSQSRRDLPVSSDVDALERDLLRTASMLGSDATGRLKSLLDHVDLTCTDFRGRCALFKASFVGDIDKVEWLWRAGADVNQPDRTGATAIWIAAQQGHNQVVQFLAEKSANITRTDESNVSPLYVASQFGHEDVVRYLVNHGAQINLATGKKATPLFSAAQEGQDSVAQILLQARADFNLATNDGSTPLYIAIRTNRAEIVELLIKALAPVDKAIQDPTDKVEKLPLVIAASSGHADVVRVLKRHGARSDKAGELAVEAAKKGGHDEVVRALRGEEPSGADAAGAAESQRQEVAEPVNRAAETTLLEDDNTAGCGRPICRHYIRNECNRRNCRYCHGPHCRFCRSLEQAQEIATHEDRADFYFRGHNR